METLAGELERRREQLFVGRAAELAALDALLDHPRKRVLYLQGMGGIGKTELLRSIARFARERDWDVVSLDARDLPRDPDELERMLSRMERLERPRLLLLDSFERLAVRERPVRERLLPALPTAWRVVMAGRECLGPAWTADSGWAELLEVIELGELSPAESRDYLRRRDVPPDRLEEIVELAGGVPLALSLASETARAVPLGELEHDPDLTETLLRQLIEQVPSPAHHRALALSAVALNTTEELLEAVLDDASPFAWLASRSFFHAGPRGIYPHDLVRHALARRIQWQHPELFYELLLDAGEYQTRRLRRRLKSEDVADIVRELTFLQAQGELAPQIARPRQASADDESPRSSYLEMSEEWLATLRGAAATPAGAGARPRRLSPGALLHAVKSALKLADRPDQLGESPLFQLALIKMRMEDVPSEVERRRQLAGFLRELARDTLQSPRDQLEREILRRTYFEPKAKQRVIAADLGMGYSTYRRHLATAIERLAAALLEQERAAWARFAAPNTDRH